jgi:hypothetical protein
VEDDLDAAQRALQSVRLRQAPADELDVAADLLKVLRVARREVVEHAHARPRRRERRRDVRADEARPARHQVCA